jgi:glutathione gamma-glutamylcysteinyltransferase
MSPHHASPAAASSFYRRPLPDGQIAFSSAEGRRIFREALEAGTMEGWFALAEQFHTQADPSFCGLGTLVVALNALEIDPGRIWKGPWRWYGEEMLDCCQPLDKVQEKGLTLDEVACLARCNGVAATTVRAGTVGAAALREGILGATTAPRGPVLIAAYSRAALGQTGSGHFSPIAGYHRGRDLALILDVARFKYPPHWVPVEDLWRSMTAVDPATGQPRGWLLLDRSPDRLLPLYFRLTANRGISDLVAALLEEVPALLEAPAGSSPDEIVAGWVAAVEARLAGRLVEAVKRRVDAPQDRVPSEHQRAIAAIVEELHQSAAYRAVQQARATAGPGSVSDELLAVLLLALPDAALGAAAEALGSLRRPVGEALGGEVGALREQLVVLRQWRCGPGGGATAPGGCGP